MNGRQLAVPALAARSDFRCLAKVANYVRLGLIVVVTDAVWMLLSEFSSLTLDLGPYVRAAYACETEDLPRVCAKGLESEFPLRKRLDPDDLH